MPSGPSSQATNDTATSEVNATVKEVLQAVSKTWKASEKWLPLYDMYRDLHRNPGVSGHEDYAADSIERELQSIKTSLPSSTNLTLQIHRDIGKAESGPGVVAVLSNSNRQTDSQSTQPDPVVLLRADIDALSVEETTGVEYASTIPGVMHACGHDMHITTLIAAVKLLIDTQTLWSGTVIACFQPSEEPGTGAQAMINDGLYERHGIPTPDFVFGAHVTPEPAGTVSMTPGVAFFRADSWEVTIKGKSGHAARPEATIDPIVTAAYAITRLQTIVSRTVSPHKVAVLTVSQINAGDLPNVIPGVCKMKINIRGGSNSLSEYIEKDMRRIITNEVQASDRNAKPNTSDQDPDNPDANPHFKRIAYLPILENKAQITDEIASMFTTILRERFNGNAAPAPGSEDFSNLAKSTKDVKEPDLTYCYWRYGSTSPQVWDKAGRDPTKIPSNHSGDFLPQLDVDKDDDPLKVGASTLFAAALSKCILSSNRSVVAKL